jgi:hypothetical protein
MEDSLQISTIPEMIKKILVVIEQQTGDLEMTSKLQGMETKMISNKAQK